MTGINHYSIYVDGKTYGRTDSYDDAAGMYFRARKLNPESTIELVDNRSGEVEKRTLTSTRVKGTVFTGRF